MLNALENIDFSEYHKSMNQKLVGRGGAGRGQGRKPKEISDAMKPVSIKMTDEQRSKLVKLGGAPWVRERIDKAKLPSE